MVPNFGTILSSRCTVEASNTGELAMPPILSDLVLFSLVAAFYTGIVIALRRDRDRARELAHLSAKTGLDG
jgi:hypothetical protein